MRVNSESGDVCIGLDIGGTNVDIGVVDTDGKIVNRGHVPMRRGARVGIQLQRIFDAIDAVVAGTCFEWDRICAVGVAAPGTLDLKAGVILQPFNLPGWENLPLAKRVSERFRKPTVLVNDANAAAFGEFRSRSGSSANSLVLFTLGTGIGSGIVLNGRLWEGAHGHAGECGHLIIQHTGGPQSPFGIHGSLELYAGSLALVRRCREKLHSGRHSSLSGLADSDALTAHAIATAAEANDELAFELVMETADYLAVGAVSVIHVLNPEVILLGGAMTFGRNRSTLGRAFLERFRQQVARQTFPIPAERTLIEFAELGANGGIVGAATWAAECVASGFSEGAIPPKDHAHVSTPQFAAE